TYLRPYYGHVLVALVAILLKSGADVLGPFLTALAIDRYLAPAVGAQSALNHHGFRVQMPAFVESFLNRWLSPQPLVGIAEIAAVYVSMLIFSFFLDFIQTYFMQWTGQKVMFDMRAQIFRRLQAMHIGFFDRNPVGRLVTRVTSDVDAVNEMFTSGVVAIFEDVFVLIFIVAIMWRMDWRLALITFSVLPPIAIATMFFRKAVRDSYRRIRTAIARINAYLQEHVGGMVVVQLFNREQRAYENFEKINRSHMEAFKDAIMAYSLYYPIVEILSWTAIAMVIWFGGGQVIRNVTTVGVLVAFMQYAQRFFRPIQDLSEKYNILQSAMAASERIFKLLDTPVEIISPPHPKMPDGPGRIEFDHVWFSYSARPAHGSRLSAVVKTMKTRSAGFGAESRESAADSDEEWVLRDVSFTIEPGQTVAVVGHTGAGKTTLISLLLRFYDVQRGSIRIDGVDVREMDLSGLRRRFGVVLQDPFLFSGTVRYNIRLGTDSIADEMVERAAEDVNVADFIRTLPGGYDEMMHERGSTLSTGQKQLISFARALAHAPKILVLDEATSSVDTETEFRVREALAHMVEGRTSVIIAHRLSTVQRADNIIVMHKGKVREMGGHQELLARRGIYWKLYQLQYKDQELAVAAGSSLPEVTAGADD
ncbi:MAG: ABC transporter ATP-binding protein, partial [Terriglobales bacterium]